MRKKKVILGVVCISIICLLVIAFLFVDYVKPKYDKGTTESLNSIFELKGLLDSFPSIGGIEYVRRIQAGTIGILFTGKALPEKIKEYCEKENCIIFPARDYLQVWQDRLSLYKASNTFSTPYDEKNFHFDGPESLRNNRYRISFFYMPNKNIW